MGSESSILEYTKNISLYILHICLGVRKVPKIYPNISNTSRLGAGPGGAAPPPLGILYILVYLCISWIYLDIFLGVRKVPKMYPNMSKYIYIFGYIFGTFLIYILAYSKMEFSGILGVDFPINRASLYICMENYQRRRPGLAPRRGPLLLGLMHTLKFVDGELRLVVWSFCKM